MNLIKKLIFFAVLIICISLAVIAYNGFKMYNEAIAEVDIQTKISNIKNKYSYVKFENLPADYIKAVIAVEDQRFYNHSGIDIVSIGRAMVSNIKEKRIVQGGSTITQQVAKNMYFTQEKSFVRKIAELFVVYQLEKNYTKQEIIELYVNISYFGDGYYGIGEASEGYFNKLPKDMTLAESTLIAGIPNAPSVYAPTKNPDLALERQKQVIRKMVESKDLTSEEAQKLYEKIE